MTSKQNRVSFLLIFWAWQFYALSYHSLAFAEKEQKSVMAEKDLAMDQVTAANTDFAIQLYKVLSVQDGADNVFFSPLSLSMVLSMTSAGARGNTESQMLAALGISGTLKDQLHIAFKDLIRNITETGVAKIANKIFVQNNYDVVPSFHQILQSMYGSSCTSLDFGDSLTSGVINDWVKKETGGKIEKLVDKLGTNTVMIVANAIYFKSLWERQFNPRRTKVAPFSISEDVTVNVNLMFQSSKFRLAFHESTDTDVLELGHNNDQTSMLVFLPRKVSGLQHLESNFGKALLDEVLASMSLVKTDVWLPAFKLEESYTLKESLNKLGMSDLFSSATANLTGISEKGDLYASEVVHKSYIEVNEEGTEAAAATGLAINKRSLEFNAVFRADHPFMFCILQKKTNSILFLGKLGKPQPVVIPHEEL